MALTDVCVKRPVSTLMFFLGVILLGVISFSNLNINLLPDLNYPKLTVLTEYSGLGPEEMEQYITTKLEAHLSAINGLKKVNSFSKEGISIITLEFHWGTDMDFAFLHTKEKVEEAMSSLPEDCETPNILEMDPSDSPIVVAVIKSKSKKLQELYDEAEFMIKPRLEQLEGVSKVEIRGGDKQEISIEINPEKIKNLGISLTEVAAAIRNNNRQSMGGTIKKDGFKFLLKVEGELQTPEQMDNVVVKKLQDRNILLKDVGSAFYKDKIKQGDTRFEAKRSITLVIYRESEGNTVDATKEIEETLDKFAEKEDLGFEIISREADLIVSSITSLEFSGLLGMGCAFFILLLFLQNYRDPLQVAVVIPISIVATFVLMFFAKVDLNIMSLGGLVLGVGMFVDNSIIVLESIFRHKKDESIVQSVISGTKEVSGAITASTFTTISIFLPVIYLYGITGKLFRDQALTVAFSLISSLLVAVTLLPAMAALKRLLKTDFIDDMKMKMKKNPLATTLDGFYTFLMLPIRLIGYILYFLVGGIVLVFVYLFRILGKLFNLVLQPTYRGFNKLFQVFDDFYHKILEKILDKKRIAVYIALVAVVMILFLFSITEKELLPKPNSAKFEIQGDTNPVYGFEETNNISKGIEEEIRKLPGVNYVFSEAGSVSKIAARSEDFSVNSIHLVVNCNSVADRISVMSKARKIIEKAKLQDYTIFLEKNTLSRYLASEGENFQIKVYYEEIPAGRTAAGAIMAKIKDLPELEDLNLNTSEGKPLYKISFRQHLLDKMNITRKQVADYIIQAVRGEQAGELRKIQRRYDIYVRVPVEGTGIMDSDKLLNLPIKLNNNNYYLRDLIDFEEVPSIKEISRESQERFFVISANVEPKKFEQVLDKVRDLLAEVDLPLNTRFEYAGEEEERTKAFESLNMAIVLAIVLVYMVMAAQFENVLQPLIIMLTVPMGLIGAFIFILLSGNSLNIISGIGILVLIGIGVNDAIVKVEYSNQLRKQGMSIREAVLTASRVRLRPILMTTFTTIFGLIPMALMSQTGSELQKPLAFVVIGGLIFTTALTLILIPVCYEVLESLKEKMKAGKKKEIRVEG